MVMIFQPKGAATDHKEGTVLVQATVAAGTSWYGANYEISSSISGVATGIINQDLDPTGAGEAARFTGCAPCVASCGPC